jgi:hypothetical protein
LEYQELGGDGQWLTALLLFISALHLKTDMLSIGIDVR